MLRLILGSVTTAVARAEGSPWQPLGDSRLRPAQSVTPSLQRRSGTLAAEERSFSRNTNQRPAQPPPPAPLPRVEGIRLQWSEEAQTEGRSKGQDLKEEMDVVRNYEERLVLSDIAEEEMMISQAEEEKRGKRFLDPDDVMMAGHMEDHDHNNSTHGEAAEGVGGTHTVNSSQDSDPHQDQQFCVDISEYMDLKWVLKDAEECHVQFSSQCETKTQNVCIDVTETKCEVVPYKDCSMGLEPQEFVEKKLTPKLFVEKSCYQGKKTIPHKKLFPECRNVTKQNCVTLWETDESGQQVRGNIKRQ